MYGPATGPTPPYTPPATPQPYAYGYPGPGPHAAAQPNAYPPPPGGWIAYGHPVVPPERSTAARVGLFLLRVFLTCLPTVSIGMLLWVPLVRAALVRRRPVDWVVLVATVLLWALGAYMVISTPDNVDTGESDAGILILMLLTVTSTVYYLVAEHRQPVAYASPAPHWPTSDPAGPSGPSALAGSAGSATPAEPAAQLGPLVPLGQVQAELDELSALLHRHERPAP
ncbi:hypothetical protein [Streptacidiphilus melanogenes]|uniref:hypothetical protein n=1 Tax=Streptacidiphilus melanogenes TaxID=411235 RepID=UPI0005A8099B|nr:hypothetical protein [Streptacidiphilus melanogenes]